MEEGRPTNVEPELENVAGTESEFEERSKRSERPARLFQKGYTRKNKDAIVMPPIFDNPLDESTMPSDDSSEINLEVHVSS